MKKRFSSQVINDNYLFPVTTIKILVSIMKDVVQPYYEENVIIQGYEQNEFLYLEEITIKSSD